MVGGGKLYLIRTCGSCKHDVNRMLVGLGVGDAMLQAGYVNRMLVWGFDWLVGGVWQTCGICGISRNLIASCTIKRPTVALEACHGFCLCLVPFKLLQFGEITQVKREEHFC